MKQNKSSKQSTIIGITILSLSIWIYLFRNEINDTYQLLTQGSLDDVVAMIRSWGMAAPILSIILMILQAFVAPIPAFLITGANGVVFGVISGIIISWIEAMLGAAGTFYLARILGMDYVKKLEKSHQLIRKVDEISQKHGMKVILVGRLLPFVSFDFLSYAAGLSTISAVHFFIATGIGMLPGTIAYVLLGNQILAMSRYSATITILVGIGIIVGLIFHFAKKKSRKTKEDQDQ